MNTIVHSHGWKNPEFTDTQIVGAVLGLLSIFGLVALFFLA